MAIDFQCPSCFASQSSPESSAGRQARCYACSSVFTIPSQLPAVPSELARSPDAITEAAGDNTGNANAAGGFPHVLVYSIGGGVVALLLLVLLIVVLALGGNDSGENNSPSEVADSGTPLAPGTGILARDASTSTLEADEVYDKYSPAVVKVNAMDIDGYHISGGTGFFISAEGGLITNAHVIDVPLAEIFEVVRAGQESGLVADFIVSDADLDLAYLKIRVPTKDYLELTPSLPNVGQTVYAIGNPRGLTNTISPGIVSGLRQRPDGYTGIQFTAPISPGSSGGPLFNNIGQVIGVTTAFVEGGQNLNIAMPSDAVMKLINRNR